VTGCILSNELLDAMPVHRVVGRHGRLREIYVTWRDGQLAEEEEEPSSPAISARLAEEGVTLEDGQRAEVCLELESWARDVAGALSKGFVLTVDYGHKATDLYSLQRREGTLRCYYRHTLSADPYQRVGSQDMTTHVDFTATAALGTRYGLTGQPLHTQALFLHNLGLRTFQRRLVAAGLGQSQRDANRMAMLELARPGGMGDFKVLVQSKNVANPSLTGLVGASRAWEERLANLPLPLLGSDHLRLMEARYPHTAQAGESGWPWG
jgi:SAM-dependent MidA family methyltransferase